MVIQDKKTSTFEENKPKTDVIISGVSGRFPNASNVSEFSKNLYNKVDMVDDTEVRWKHDGILPSRMGKISGIEKFDANFFGIHSKQAKLMDPQGRLLLECAYEAVLDSGTNPMCLRGSKTGVFIAASASDAEHFCAVDSDMDLHMTGCARSLLANRISFAMDLKGPSLAVDSACASSMYALNLAFNAIRYGECEAAIVGGSNLLLSPFGTMAFHKLGTLSGEGICRPFDENANGFVRSDAVGCLFLQSAAKSKRIYCHVLHSKISCDGFKKDGLLHPSSGDQAALMKELYAECGLSPNQVGYLECHMTGTRAGDPSECNAIDSVFGTIRNKPLLVGSVKSNMGHGEAAAGICSLIKSILACHNGLIPPNINFSEPRSDISALVEGRLKVVTDPTFLEKPYVAVNSFGFGGANGHTLLRANSIKKEDYGIPRDSLPRLVVWSGRTKEACVTIFDSVTNQPFDAEFIALLNNTQTLTNAANLYRGFGLFEKQEKENATCLGTEIIYNSGIKRPLVWLFSGMGSQWNEMGKSLLKIPQFYDTIQELHTILIEKNIDLLEIITSKDPKIFENILNSFIAITAIQIAMVDVLKALDVTPDFILGHSFGEIACGYADGCLTAEEAILCSYWRGQVSICTKVIHGAMALVGMGYQDIKNILHPGIEVACHNTSKSCTITGPAEDVYKFMAVLQSQDVFAKEVYVQNMAYHSATYISEIGSKYLVKLKEIITKPKQRSSKWLSTSIPETKWSDADFCSAEYHLNNLLSPVLLEEACSKLPKESLILEIAPSALLSGLLRKSTPEMVLINLAQKNSLDNEKVFLKGIGRLFINGVDVNVNLLFPQINFPVSNGTAMISPLVRWDHSEDWKSMDQINNTTPGGQLVKLNFKNEDTKYMLGHVVNDHPLFPATGYLYLVWKLFGKILGQPFLDMSTEFEDVKFLRATNISEEKETTFSVCINQGSGHFEIMENSVLIVTGVIREYHGTSFNFNKNPLPNTELTLTKEDFYKELWLRGYHYKDDFQSVLEARCDGLWGKVEWNSNFVTFMDNVLQVLILSLDTRSLMVPTGFSRIRINGKLQQELAESNNVFEVHFLKNLNVIVCGGVEFKGLKSQRLARRKPEGQLMLESYEFIPYKTHRTFETHEAACFLLRIVNEDLLSNHYEITEEEGSRGTIIEDVQKALSNIPKLIGSFTLLTDNEDRELPGVEIRANNLDSVTEQKLLIVSEFLSNGAVLHNISGSLQQKAFIISREGENFDAGRVHLPESMTIAAEICTENNETLVLLKYQKEMLRLDATIIKVSPVASDSNHEWLENAKATMSRGEQVIFVSENEKMSGVLGLVKCIRKEIFNTFISCVIIDDPRAPEFDLNNDFYKKQLDRQLGINVYKNGHWGCYSLLPLKTNTSNEKPELRDCIFNTSPSGGFSTLSWQQRIPFSNHGSNRNEMTDLVRIQYAALNYRDTLIVNGRLMEVREDVQRYQRDCMIGFEFSGISRSTGKRVMGIAAAGALGTYFTADKSFLFNVPSHWTLEEAATVPIVYLTVYCCYFSAVTIETGKTILIHSGAGGVGLAAIRTALAYGLDVFTTVSTSEKKEYLLSLFPQLKLKHIGNSRDTTFYDMVMTETSGVGVDYVLNSLSGDKLVASIDCVAKGGHFIEIGKYDIINDTKLGLSFFTKDIHFHAITVTTQYNDNIKSRFLKDIESGIVVPLKRTVFPACQSEDAFKFIAKGKHIGKVLIKIRENATDEASLPIKVKSTVVCNPETSYIIVGGLGGMGLELADWLVLRGCRKLVLSSSRGVTSSYQRYRIRLWESYGVEVIISTADITTHAGCLELINKSRNLASIEGIFNLALRLQDGLFLNQTSAKFKEVLAVKALATEFLDEISRNLCSNLKYFVVFSSIACSMGSSGQSNYGMANSIMENIIENRVSSGYPGKVIQFGVIGDVGAVMDLSKQGVKVEFDVHFQSIHSCMESMDDLICSSSPIVSSYVLKEKLSLQNTNSNSPIEAVMKVLGLRDLKSISMNMTLAELGADSLMVVEIKNVLGKDFNIILVEQEIQTLTFEKLSQYTKNNFAKQTINGFTSEIQKVNINDIWNCINNFANQELILIENDKYSKNDPIIFFPGSEGFINDSYKDMICSLQMPVYFVQYPQDKNKQDLSEIAKSVQKRIFGKSLNKIDKFKVLGYSYGGIIALEFVAMLESSGMKGQFILVESTPSIVKTMLVNSINAAISESATTKQVTEASFLHKYFVKFVKGYDEEILTQVSTCNTEDEKIQKLLDALTELLQKKGKGEEANHVVELFLVKIKKVFDFTKTERKGKLVNSDITLIVGDEVPCLEGSDREKEASAYTNGKVEIFTFENNHFTILANQEVFKIINEKCVNLL